MLTLVRNVASSVGISVVIANLTNMTTTFRSQLAEHISPFNDALQEPDVTRWLDLATDQGRALADQMITLQAAIMAYADDFMLLTAICALSIPFVFAIGSTASLRGGRVSVREARARRWSSALPELLPHLLGMLAEAGTAPIAARLIADRRRRRIRHRPARRLDADAAQMRVRDEARPHR